MHLGSITQSVKKTYRIEINTHLNLLRLPAQLQQFLLRPPFCRLRPLLVEFANVIEIVNIVPVRFLTFTALARWRDPNAVDPRRLQVRKCLLQTFPMPLVGRDVPFESLEKASVLRRWFLFWKGRPVRSGKRDNWGFLSHLLRPCCSCCGGYFTRTIRRAEYYRIKALKGEMTLSKKNYLKETWRGKGKERYPNLYRARAAWLFEKMFKSGGQQFSACSRNHVYEL
jgi:hypothetical protein